MIEAGKTFCVQCIMRAMLEGRECEAFNESLAEHQRRVHPNLHETKAERQRLEEMLDQKFDGSN